VKIEKILAKKAELEKLDLAHDQRMSDEYIAKLEMSRDLTQTVVHVDCDAFYAAVEELDWPELNELPFCVGKGVLTTCNYHARKFGCRSGMAGFVAKKLCPQLIQLPLNFEKYTAKAQEVREIIAKYDPRFESASIDEAYLNITKYCVNEHIGPDEAVEQLRREVHEKTKITISAGIAANAKLAKICSNQNKPNGQYKLENDRSTIMAFMRDLPTRKVNGIGRVFERELDAIGIKTCGDIYQYRQYLSKLFGEKAFRFLMQCYLGLGRTEVRPAEEYERKSIGTESTFSDMTGHIALCERLRRTAEDLEKNMMKAQFTGRTLVLKIKLHTYEVFTRQVIPPRAVYLADDLYKYSLPMLAKLEQEFPGLTLRLMGLTCTHLVSTKKTDSLVDFFGLTRRPGAEYTSVGAPTASAIHTKRTSSALADNQIEDLETINQLEEASLHSNEKGCISREERWDCPICLRPQPAHERDFNAHIDLCLSRQTIREAVQDASREPSGVGEMGGNKRVRYDGRYDGRKNRTRSKEDRKQARLYFS
jgi:DNA polymerase kappa